MSDPKPTLQDVRDQEAFYRKAGNDPTHEPKLTYDRARKTGDMLRDLGDRIEKDDREKQARANNAVCARSAAG